MPRDTAGLGYSPFDRLYWGTRSYFLFLRVMRCFSSPRSPHAQRDGGIAPAGLPHSEIPGSMGICPSPGLFAACHVLLRLREPRHPPCALVSLRFSFMAMEAPSAPLAYGVRLSPHVFAFDSVCFPESFSPTAFRQCGALVALLFVSFSSLMASLCHLASSMSVCSFQ